MARPLRIEYAGAWYHVMNRGLQKGPIFLNDQDRWNFLNLLAEISQVFSIEVHAFSLMGNHYHLLLRTPVANLSRAMRHLNGLYTQRFNKAHDRDGPIFRGRYKAILADENDYLTQLIRYIHRNPVEAGLCTKADEYSWTSHCDYLNNFKRFHWLHTEYILSLFSGTTRLAKKSIKSFVSQNTPDEIVLKLKRPALNVMGSEGYYHWIKQNQIKDAHKKTSHIPKKQKTLKIRQKPTDILHRVSLMNDTSPTRLRGSRYNNQAKIEAAYFLREILGMPLPRIAKFTKLKNENAVSQILFRVRKKIKNDRRYAKRINERYHYIASSLTTGKT